MLAAIVCREMKWDWKQYQRQPAWFIDILVEMFGAESDEIRRKISRKK